MKSRIGLWALGLMLSCGAGPDDGSNPSEDAIAASSLGADQASETDSTGFQENRSSQNAYYELRRDLRRCASPMCGGFFVHRVNGQKTQCTDKTFQDECYVSRVQFSGKVTKFEDAIVYGRITPERNGFGKLEAKSVWTLVGKGKKKDAVFTRVKSNGIMCVTWPCPTLDEEWLNWGYTFRADQLNTTQAGLTAHDQELVDTALNGTDGILVAGKHAFGQAVEIVAERIYVPYNTEFLKPCVVGGCSGEICSDTSVITTCEYPPRAGLPPVGSTCERQKDGACGWTYPKNAKSACVLAEENGFCPECYSGEATCTYRGYSASASSCGTCQARTALFSVLCEHNLWLDAGLTEIQCESAGLPPPAPRNL